HGGEHRDRLAGAGFPDDGQNLAGIDLERNTVHRPERPGCRLELDDEIFDLEKRHHDLFSLGSRASRNPSPIRLMASTVTRMASPGKVTTHQARWMNSRASASIVPHSGVGGWAPMPRNPSAAASRIAEEKASVACTMSGARQFGRIVRNMRRSVPAPATLEPTT